MGHRRRIQDAIDGVTGTVVLQEVRSTKMSNKITQRELYELRDKSGLSRQEFYLQMVENAEIKEVVEVGNQ